MSSSASDALAETLLTLDGEFAELEQEYGADLQQQSILEDPEIPITMSEEDSDPEETCLSVRRLWKEFSQASDAVVFVIDVSDPSRFAESKTELNSILQDEQLEFTPLLILGNKIDLPRAASEEEIMKIFDLKEKTTGKGTLSWRQKTPKRPVEVFMCSILKQQGYGKAFRWLGQYM